MKLTQEQLDLYANADIGGPAIGAWPRNKGERIKPHKGAMGDGGAGDRETERQARIKSATDEINRIFNNQGGDPANNRDTMYQDQRKAVYDLNTNEVNRQAGEAERVNRFGLARSGLLGGSADIDANAELNRRTNEGLLRSGGIADQASADLKVQDERTRSNLLSMAQSGIDTGSASTMALEGLKANAANAAAARGGSTIGSLFNDMAQAYLVNQGVVGKASNANPYAQWFGVSSPQDQYSGNVTK